LHLIIATNFTSSLRALCTGMNCSRPAIAARRLVTKPMTHSRAGHPSIRSVIRFGEIDRSIVSASTVHTQGHDSVQARPISLGWFSYGLF
jgi:hypothetical protein